MRLDLSDVTLCAADSVNIELTKRAIQTSIEHCKFAEVVLFTHAPIDGPFRTVEIPKLDRQGYQNFRIKPPPTVETPYTLFIEWDGFVVEPRAWRDEFRNYDFLGAVWLAFGQPLYNSGFCLQSKRLHDAFTDPRIAMPEGERNVDGAICGRLRPLLEKEFGIRFPTPEVANLFSYEFASVPVRPTFGFHGLSNMVRYLSDAQMLETIELADPSVLRSWQFSILICKYAMVSKFHTLEQLYSLMRSRIPPEEILTIFRRDIRQPDADQIFRLCEQLVDGSMWRQR